MNRERLFSDMYRVLLDTFGPSGWWPAESPFEMAVGAILTQNTNWKNASRAIRNLKSQDALSVGALLDMPVARLEELIRPAGYFRMKARRLINFVNYLHTDADDDFDSLKDRDFHDVRDSLLSIKGIGPETADSMLCYGLRFPVFVVDAYTARIFHRHGIVEENIDYHSLQASVMDVLPPDVALFNEFHALLVCVGSEFCLKKAGLCEKCCLNSFLDCS